MQKMMKYEFKKIQSMVKEAITKQMEVSFYFKRLYMLYCIIIMQLEEVVERVAAGGGARSQKGRGVRRWEVLGRGEALGSVGTCPPIFLYFSCLG
jgi:hypothetical protein